MAQLRNKVSFELEGFQKAQVDFCKSKCSGGGLGNKKGLSIYLTMVAKLISNLSVFLVLGWRKRPRSLGGWRDRQTKWLTIRISLAD